MDNGWLIPRGNAGGLVTVKLPAPKQAGDRLSLTIAYGGKPHVAKRAPWDGGFVWATPRMVALGSRPRSKAKAATSSGRASTTAWSRSPPSPSTSSYPRGLRLRPTAACSEWITSQTAGRVWNWRARSPNNYAIAIDVAPYQLGKTIYQSRYHYRMPVQYPVPARREQTGPEAPCRNGPDDRLF